jgi:hypothetical protein
MCSAEEEGTISIERMPRNSSSRLDRVREFFGKMLEELIWKVDILDLGGGGV